jgi:HD-GYP domain-containing protein (c-di-GMP phosphodiesterase class II)/DNA-binding CsgD family transcriptional regulator
VTDELATQLGRDPSTLGEVLLAFSTVTSQGLGLGTDHGIRTCYIGMCLAADLELPAERTADLYYASLAKDGGCTCGQTQMAEFLGTDEREALSDLLQRDTDNELEMLRWLFRNAGRGSGSATRARRTIGALVHGSRFERDVRSEECEVAQRVADRLGLSDEAALALTACTERWDGKGHPLRLAGDAIPLVARVINLGAAVEIAERFSGRDAAVELVRRRSGKAFDPRIGKAFLGLADREEFWEGLDEERLSERVLAMEPVNRRHPGGGEALDRFTEVLADITDLKRAATAGHARRVTARAGALGERLGLSRGELVTLRRAALIHGVGLIVMSARTLANSTGGIAYRAHSLAPAQLLEGLPSLRDACELAALHHERVDGSGWPAGASANRLPTSARILALACALDELTSGKAAAEPGALHSLALTGGFDRVVLDACAAELGTRTPRVEWPAGLTEREVEVLRLGAAGLSVREIGKRLLISHHTARHHLESAYAKIGCSSRAGAALFAAEHGLLD